LLGNSSVDDTPAGMLFDEDVTVAGAVVLVVAVAVAVVDGPPPAAT
jgi:hypothetical protein